MLIMLNVKIILRFFDKTFIVKLLILSLLYSMVPLAEIFLLIYIGARIGNYLALALAASTGLVGMLIALKYFQKNLFLLKQRVKQGVYPGKEFINLIIVFTGGILLLTPGFITDFMGFLLFVPIIKNAAGRIFIQKTQTSLKELYEYLRLYDF